MVILFCEPTCCPGSGFWSSKEASWVGRAPPLISWEVCQPRDPHLEEEVVVELHLALEVVVVVVVVVEDHLTACCSVVPTNMAEVGEEEADYLFCTGTSEKERLVVPIDAARLREEEEGHVIRRKT